ncbi:MAG: hypothetical protein ACE14M_00135 [Terriglobales bacterium]
MSRKTIALLLLLTLGALLVHGYHPAVEDGEIYLPGIKKDLNPALYPFGDQFFMSHARMTLFDELVAASIRILHLPFDYAIFLWHLACIFGLLAGCWQVGRRCFDDPRAAWGGTALVAALLTIPVAGTSLYIMDQYLTTRDLSAAGIMLAIANGIEGRFLRAVLWSVLVAVIHPLMAVFGIALLAFVWVEEHRVGSAIPQRAAAQVGFLLPLRLSFDPVSNAYRQALETRSYFFLVRWEWYEWLGIFAPLALLWCVARYARQHGLRNVRALSRALILYELVFFVAALVLSIPALADLTLLQPMRSLHLVFILLFVLLGGIAAQTVLKGHAWRWLLLFVPLCSVMFYVQRQLFPSTVHLELPGRASHNPWVQSFEWIRTHTPQSAIFALDPNHMNLPGEDQHGFRAIAERSMLADAVKDSGAVTMFPTLADKWQEQVSAQTGWKNFHLEDFQRLRRQYGVSWLVLQRPGIPGLACPYQNDAVVVCRVE